MNLINFDLPCSVDLNVFKAYFNIENFMLKKSPDSKRRMNAFDFEWNSRQPKALRILVLDKIIKNWGETAIFTEIPRREDRNYILSHLDVELPLKILSLHINDDFFWRKCYQHRWKTISSPREETAWINIYMERHLQEFIENIEPCDYDQEGMQTTLDICAAYINHLEINQLQPAMEGERNDHIPFDFILSNLPDLRTLRLTYCAKTMGTNFYLGCSTLSQNDTVLLARGLSRCYDLVDFCDALSLQSTKIEPYQMGFLSQSLDKGCQNLTSISLPHCSIGDDGIRNFLDSCSKESFMNLRLLNLENNRISPEGAFVLSRALRKRPIEKLILRLNPIKSDGMSAIFSILQDFPIKVLDISGCCLTETITKLFAEFILRNRTLTSLDASNNTFGEEFGKRIYEIIGHNEVLQDFDLRNTGLSLDLRTKLKNILTREN